MNKTEKTIEEIITKLKFGLERRVLYFDTEYVRETPDHLEFGIIFIAYNLFPMRVDYDSRKGISYCIDYGQRELKVNEYRQYLTDNDFDMFIKEIKQEIELRIPDKFLEEKGLKEKKSWE